MSEPPPPAPSRLKLVVGFVLFVALGLLALMVPYHLARPWLEALQERGTLPFYVGMGGLNLALLGLMIGLVWLFARRLDGRGMKAAGVYRGTRSVRLFLLGAAITAVAGTVASLAYYALEQPQLEWISHGVPTALGLLLVSVVIGVLQPLHEELWFRSYPLRALIDLTSPRVAILINALVFGGLHLLNPHYTAVSAALAGLAGAMMATAVVRTGSIWMAAGLHYGWNQITGSLFFSTTWIRVTQHGQRVRSFDAVEGTWMGLLCTLAAFGAVLWLTRTLHDEPRS